MKYPFEVNIFLIVSFLSKFKNFIWSLLKEFYLHFSIQIYCINFLWIKNRHPLWFLEDKVLLEYRVKCL